MTTPHFQSKLSALDSRISRRSFLWTLSLAASAASCQRLPYDRSEFVVPETSTVALLPVRDYSVDFSELIGRGLRELGVDVRGRRVFLKPNIVEYEEDTVINTHPLVVAGAALAFRSAGAASVVIGEGPGHRRDMEYLLTATGLYDYLREYDLKFVDLNHDDVRYVPLRSRFTKLDRIALPVELLAADFVVSMPKLKTHHWAGMTASMKNFFGAVPGAVYGWPKNVLHFRGVQASILDLNATIRPHFAIVDAVTAMEGDGPIMGKPRHVGCLAMGADVVATDATCARIMGLNPEKIPYLSVGSRYLGQIDANRIRQRGDALSRFASTFDVLEQFRAMRLTSD
jgi:uncharacterized protein (DUF362 family)